MRGALDGPAVIALLEIVLFEDQREFLTRVGVRELVAKILQNTWSWPFGWLPDPARLVEYRQTLRTRMARSPLCDATGFARQVEAAYRKMWRRWSADRSR